MQIPTILLALTAAVSAQQQAPKGLKIQWIGHSFHVFLPAPVAKLANEAKIQGHVNLGFDMIGGSSPCEHWNRAFPEEKVTSGFSSLHPDRPVNATAGQPMRKVIDDGTADVVTLATQAVMPEPCIAKFVNRAFAKKKQADMRVMVQETWIPASTNPDEGCVATGCSNRDAATFETLQSIRSKIEVPYKDRLRKQLTDLQKGTAANYTTIVPAWDVVLGMRELIVKGGLPGVAKQSALFRDNLGHPTAPLQDAVSYLWFGALYGINPQGFKSLGNPQLAPVLQKLAWDTLTKEPLRGTVAAKGQRS